MFASAAKPGTPKEKVAHLGGQADPETGAQEFFVMCLWCFEGEAISAGLVECDGNHACLANRAWVFGLVQTSLHSTGRGHGYSARCRRPSGEKVLKSSS